MNVYQHQTVIFQKGPVAFPGEDILQWSQEL